MYRNEVSQAAVGGVGLTLAGMVSQSDFSIWAGGLIVLGGAVLYLIDQRRRNAIATDDLHRRTDIETKKLERDAILVDARAEIRDLRKELHDVRDQLNEARTKLAVAEAISAGKASSLIVPPEKS
jgi:hypothetical protein